MFFAQKSQGKCDKGRRASGQTPPPPSPFLPRLPPTSQQPPVIIAHQTAFIISINLGRLRRGVMRRPARLSASDSPPRQNERGKGGVGREKRVQEGGWRETMRE